MAYISPSSTVWVIQNCPLDNTYEHTIWHYNARGQQDYFRTLRKYLLEAQTYQRVGRDRIRVELPYSGLYDCNYLMFQNLAYEGKCFYAFITDIEYINNNVCEIQYELDVMQTWMFDYQLQPSFVEREHAMTDVVGDNILPEPVGLGEYVYNTVPLCMIPEEELKNIVIVAIVDVSDTGGGGDSGGGDSGGDDSGGDDSGGDDSGGDDSGGGGTDVVLDITGTIHNNLYHSDVDGHGIEHMGAVTTEPIDISSYDSFTVTRTASSVYNCFYDSGPSYISGSSFRTDIGDTVVGGASSLIQIPSNAKYVIISNDVPDNISVTVTIPEEDILGDPEDPVNDVVDALTDGPGVNGHVYDGIYGAATLWAFLSDDVASINAKLNEYIQKPEAVIGVYTCNSFVLDYHLIPEGGLRLDEETFGQVYDVHLGQPLNPSLATIDGYLPRNKKLLTYPYNLLHLDNMEGGSLELRYEFFELYHPSVKTMASVTQPVEVILRPTHYKNSGTAMDLTQSIKIGNFPLCSWAVDAYQAWVAQNAVPTLARLGSAAATGLVFGVPLMLASAAGVVADTISQAYTASIQADVTRGNVSAGSALFGHKLKAFYYARMSITDQHARMIDEFFDRYGYATNRVKQPNISGRPHWNYIKTKGAVITGKVPATDANRICRIYDQGVTFWKSGNEIGNYSLNNRIPT